MAGRSGTDLEALPLDGEAGREAGSHRRLSTRAGLIMVAAVGVTVAVVAGPVRGALDRREVDAAASAYAAYRGFEEQRLEDATPLLAAEVPDNQADVDAALAALDREEAGHLRSLALGLRFPLVVDPSSWTMARAMGAALRDRAADLARQSAWLSAAPARRGPQAPDPSPAAQRALDHALALLGPRLSATGRHIPNDAPRPLRAAAGLSNTLRGWADQPTGTVLVGADGLALYELNVDTAGVSVNDFQSPGLEPSGPSYLIDRQGWVAAVMGTQVAAYPSGQPPHLLPFNVASGMFAAARPDAVWLVIDGLQVVEVDQNGRPLTPVWQVPARTAVLPAVVAEGLVLGTPEGGLEAWVPATGHRQLITTGPAVLLAANDHTVLWERAPPGPNEPSAPVHVTNLSSGTDNAVTTRLDVQVPEDRVATACAFSPDGRLVACPDLTRGEPGLDNATYDVAIIDLASRTATVVPGAAADQPQQPMVWRADGSRLFTTTIVGGKTYIAMWDVGAGTATELRYHPKALVGLAALGQTG